MNKKIVAIYGSQRKNGNSAFLVNTILDSILDHHVEVEKFYLHDMNINGCKGCFYCRKEQKCMINDDMDSLIKSIMNADKVILSIPIFMFQSSGTIKQMIDRLYPLLKGENGKYTKLMDSKDTILVYSQGAPIEEAFQDYMEINKKSLSLLGFNITDTLVCTNANMIGSAKDNFQICKKATMLGNDLF